jgi:GNAT superfamily N-acetyltransferase
MNLRVRPMERADLLATASLLTDYMHETFGRPWSGSTDALLRDGFGAEMEVLLAVRHGPVGFAAFSRAYDLHHCLAGGVILDLFVGASHRGLGVALALIVAVASHVRARGGAFVKGQTVEHPGLRETYERLAVSFPGADCIVGGRAFRALADLDGRAPREMVRRLPDRAWNFES